MKQSRIWSATLLCLAAFVGFVFLPWYAVVVVLVCALLLRHSAVALAVAVVADLFYGQPSGALHIVSIPYTLFTLLSVALLYGVRRKTRNTFTAYLQ